jgi:pimeloyl-ACP methyl ester carboxylesterase
MPFLGAGSGVELHYYDDDFTDPWRSAPTMLLQHGFSRNGRFWYNWVPLLSRQFRILRPDMRGMGGSVIGEAQYEPSLDTFVDDVRNILDNLEIEDVVYVGESFGGIIGLNFAHKYPERTRALVLCNTPCRLPRRERSGRGGDVDDALRRSVGAWSTATINNRLDTRAAPPGLVEWYISEMDRTPSSIGQSLQAYLDTLDFSPYLKEVETPTLLLVGEESPTSTLEQQRFMAGQLPDSQLVVYPGLGHGINAIHPEWCTQQVRQFVASLTN